MNYTSLTAEISIVPFLMTFELFSQDWSGQGLGSITSEICGLIVVLSGTILLHVTKDYERIPQSRSAWLFLLSNGVFTLLSLRYLNIIYNLLLCRYLRAVISSLTTRLNGELLQHVKDERTSDEEKALRRQEMF